LYFRDRGTLAVDGILIDTIGSVSPKCPIVSAGRESPWVFASKLALWLRQLDIVVEELRSNGGDLLILYPNSRYTWEEAYWRTLSADNRVSESATEYYRDCSKYMRRVEDAVMAAGGVEAQCLFDDEYPSQNDYRFNQDIGLITHSRSFFTTHHGYLGLGSSRILPGDKVCIFLGGITPFIIREKISVSAEHGSPVWTLVGEAYIYGLMDGEGLVMGVPEDIFLV
jgi:hypothetical protein